MCYVEQILLILVMIYLMYALKGQSSFTTKSREKGQQSLMKACEDLVNELMLREEAWPFLKPVTRREVCIVMMLLCTLLTFNCVE